MWMIGNSVRCKKESNRRAKYNKKSVISQSPFSIANMKKGRASEEQNI